MKNFQVISLIPTWHNVGNNPNTVQVEADDHESALHARLRKLGIGYDNFHGTFVVIDDADYATAVMFSVSSYLSNRTIDRVEFGS